MRHRGIGLAGTGVLLPALLAGALLAGLGRAGGPAAAQPDCRAFAETGQQACGRFLTYWQEHGGLAQQGYPISGALQEVSDTNGQTYTVQYFERAVFELHPENQPPYDVLLTLLGDYQYQQKYAAGAPGQTPNTEAGSTLYPQTGHRLGGVFQRYWLEHGGLAQQGYPISDEFTEVSALDGKPYTVQYFERAVFEQHPENQPPYDVLLSQLGTFRFRDQHGAAGTPAPTAAPTAAAPTATPAPAANVALVWRLTGSDVGAFKSPGGIALDSQQNLYVVDLANDRVQKFDTAGHYLLSWGSYGEGPGQFSFSNSAGIAIDSHDHVDVTDSAVATADGHPRVEEFDAMGRFLGQFGTGGGGDGQFIHPIDLVFDSHDNAFVIDDRLNRVQKFDSSGHFLLGWGGLVDTGFLTVDAQDRIFVADYGTNQVKEYDDNGLALGTPVTGLSYPLAVAVDAQGHIFVTDGGEVASHGVPRVQEFDASGRLLAHWGGWGTGPGQFDLPGSVLVDAAGDVYVSDAGNNTVQKFHLR